MDDDDSEVGTSSTGEPLSPRDIAPPVAAVIYSVQRTPKPYLVSTQSSPFPLPRQEYVAGSVEQVFTPELKTVEVLYHMEKYLLSPRIAFCIDAYSEVQEKMVLELSLK